MQTNILKDLIEEQDLGSKYARLVFDLGIGIFLIMPLIFQVLQDLRDGELELNNVRRSGLRSCINLL